MQDTIFTTDGNLLRTHTSSIQVRALEKIKPPLRIVAPGRVFRYERIDASHAHTFYQMEGMMIDREVTVDAPHPVVDIDEHVIDRRDQDQHRGKNALKADSKPVCHDFLSRVQLVTAYASVNPTS